MRWGEGSLQACHFIMFAAGLNTAVGGGATPLAFVCSTCPAIVGAFAWQTQSGQSSGRKPMAGFPPVRDTLCRHWDPVHVSKWEQTQWLPCAVPDAQAAPEVLAIGVATCQQSSSSGTWNRTWPPIVERGNKKKVRRSGLVLSTPFSRADKPIWP